MAGPSRQTLWRRVASAALAASPAGLAAVVALVAFSYGFSPIGDENDVWWHLKAGKVIDDNGGWPPERDVFAYTSSDQPWHNHEWLAEWAMYGVYRLFEPRQLGGLRAVILVKSLVLVATFLLVFRLATLRAGDSTVAAILTVLAVVVSRYSLHARPPVISYCFTALFLWLLYGAYWRYDVVRSRAIRLVLLPPLTLLWANLHGGFLVGIVLTAFFALGALFDGVVEWLKAGRRDSFGALAPVRMARGFAVCALCCLIVTLFNPSGFKLYGMYARVMSDPSLVRDVAELKPPDFFFNKPFEVALLAFILFGSLVRRRLPATVDYLILVFFFHNAIQHVRHLPLFAVTTTPILAWQIRGLYDDLKPSWRPHWRPAMAVAAVLVAVWAVACPSVAGESRLKRNARLIWREPYDPRGYPEEVCYHLLNHSYPGRLFNEIHFAGYMIWRLSPDPYQVFTDSRFDVFGGQYKRLHDRVAEGMETASGRRLWRELLDDWDVNVVVIDGWKPLNQRLDNSGEWQRVFSQPWRDPRFSDTDARNCFNVWIRKQPRPVRERP